MKAAIATGIEDIDQFLHISNDWPQPTLATVKDGKTGKLVAHLQEGHLIVKVLACALAPGDCRLFKGKTDLMQLPKHKRPYIIGSDVCGIVTEVDTDEDYFHVGDRIIARFDEPQPHGMCAEYACVKTALSEKCPTSIPAIEACTLPASAAAAKLVAEKYVSEGNRVLLLGASGGVGTFLCQYVKLQGASYLAATTTQKQLAQSLGVDDVIDYRNRNWWEMESQYGCNPFDVVIDLVNGENWTKGARSGTTVLKPRAPYVQLLMGVETEIDSRGFRILSVLFQLMSLSIYVKCHRSGPQHVSPKGLELKPGHLKSLLDDVEQKKIRVVLDPSSPFGFDTKSVRAAMKLQRSIHAHGKVVIEIAKDDMIHN